jgi:hypothetical protein
MHAQHTVTCDQIMATSAKSPEIPAQKGFLGTLPTNLHKYTGWCHFIAWMASQMQGLRARRKWYTRATMAVLRDEASLTDMTQWRA